MAAGGRVSAVWGLARDNAKEIGHCAAGSSRHHGAAGTSSASGARRGINRRRVDLDGVRL